MSMRIGALWKKVSREGGKEFHSGNITFPGFNINIAVFPNTEFKEGSNQPTHHIVWSQDFKKDDKGQQGGFDNFEDDNPL